MDPEAGEETLSTRDALAAAYDAHSEPEGDAATSAPPEAGSPPAAPSEPLAEPPAPQAGEKAPAGERIRDALGRFVEKASAPTDPSAAQQPAAQPSAQPAVAERAPVNVPPALREHWGSLPQGFRDYTTQREQQVQQLLQQTSRERSVAHAFMNAVQPYQQAIQIEAGGDPVRAIAGLMDTASRLRFGTEQEKALTVARIVSSYGVSIEALDSALAGIAPPNQGGGANGIDVRGLVQRELAPLFQHARARQQESNARIEHEVQSELQTFAADPKNEFFEDVRTIMADTIEIAERQGHSMSMKDAYDRACLLHPEVSKVILARQAGQSAQRLTSAAQRARAAAVSVQGAAPVGNPTSQEPSNVREAIEAAIEAHSRV